MTPIEAREQDIAGYQVNIDNYAAILKLIPPDLPAELEPYALAPVEQLIDVLSFNDIEKVSDFQFRKKLEATLLTERLEQRKSKFVLMALLANKES